jgi:NTP pyrophosphatase (non-canonical NTP hydrolase)
MKTIGDFRTKLMHVIALNGEISRTIAGAGDVEGHTTSSVVVCLIREQFCALGNLLDELKERVPTVSLSLANVMVGKMILNRKKYDCDSVRKAGGTLAKWREYNTGVTDENHYIFPILEERETKRCYDEIGLPDRLQHDIVQFGQERLWTDKYTPRNLMFCVSAELGELSEEIQWINDDTAITTIQTCKIDKILQEIADVSIYLFRLGHVHDLKLREVML